MERYLPPFTFTDCGAHQQTGHFLFQLGDLLEPGAPLVIHGFARSD